MKKIFLIGAMLAIAARTTIAGTNELAQIREQFCAYHLSKSAEQNPLRTELLRFDRHGATNEPPSLAEVRPLIEKQNADGSWADIDYKDQDRSSWGPSRHTGRIAELAAAWRCAPADDPLRARSAAAIHAALAFWKTNDFQCPNWWHNRIGVPKTLGAAAIFLGDELRPDERNFLTDVILKRAGFDMTGQNRVWLAGIELDRALLLDNAKLARKAATVIWIHLFVSAAEGVQPDFSFHQHGPQLQIGVYGLSFAGDMTKWMTILRGTSLAPDAKKADVLRGYMNDGIAWTMWRGRMDASFIGRQFDLDTLAAHGRSATMALAKFDTLTGATNRIEPQGNRAFWRSDCMVHRQPEFMTSLKMCSDRVIGAESLNSENLSGYFAGDGVLLVTKSGREYENIFPLWDWRKLPGITAPQSSEPPPPFANYKLATAFVGGVSDGTNGCAAFDYSRDGVRAHKAYFFLGDQIICLGAGISSTQALPVSTSVNQCWRRGEVRRDGASVYHDDIRYLALNETKFQISDGAVTGSWLKVRDNSATPRAPVTGEVFTITIDHGVRPADAEYAYAILPGAQKELMCHVILNTTNVQAIADDHGNMMAVFYGPGDLRCEGHALTVDQPCVLIARYDEHPIMYAADPSHKLGRLAFSWDGHYRYIHPPTKLDAGRTTASEM